MQQKIIILCSETLRVEIQTSLFPRHLSFSRGGNYTYANAPPSTRALGYSNLFKEPASIVSRSLSFARFLMHMHALVDVSAGCQDQWRISHRLLAPSPLPRGNREEIEEGPLTFLSWEEASTHYQHLTDYSSASAWIPTTYSVILTLFLRTTNRWISWFQCKRGSRLGWILALSTSDIEIPPSLH